MTNSDLENILRHHEIRPSSSRILVVRTLADASSPLSTYEIEERLGTVDRSSITRVLQLFQQKGLVHTIHDGSHFIRYELCPDHSHKNLDHMHAHFHCTECDKTICLECTRLPLVTLPAGYLPTGANFVISGICPDCAKKKTLE